MASPPSEANAAEIVSRPIPLSTDETAGSRSVCSPRQPRSTGSPQASTSVGVVSGRTMTATGDDATPVDDVRERSRLGASATVWRRSSRGIRRTSATGSARRRTRELGVDGRRRGWSTTSSRSPATVRQMSMRARSAHTSADASSGSAVPTPPPSSITRSRITHAPAIRPIASQHGQQALDDHAVRVSSTAWRSASSCSTTSSTSCAYASVSAAPIRTSLARATSSSRRTCVSRSDAAVSSLWRASGGRPIRAGCAPTPPRRRRRGRGWRPRAVRASRASSAARWGRAHGRRRRSRRRASRSPTPVRARARAAPTISSEPVAQRARSATRRPWRAACAAPTAHPARAAATARSARTGR